MSFSPQHLVVVNLLLLAMIAYSASSIVATGIRTRLLPAPQVEIEPPPEPFPQDRPKPVSHYERIVRRDIFNPVPEPTPAPVVEAPPEESDLSTKISLTGVVVNQVPERSFAVIEQKRGREQRVYQVGHTIEGTDATVARVTWGKIIVSRPSGEEYLEIESPGGARGRTTLTSRGRSAVSSRSRSSASSRSARERARDAAKGYTPDDENIQQVDDNEYVVAREEVDNAFENLSQVFTQVRAVPHFEGGRSTGFRLFAIRQGSLFDKIGLKNGDILRSINDLELTDPSRALSMMTELRGESELTVDVIRNRQPMTLNYQIE